MNGSHEAYIGRVSKGKHLRDSQGTKRSAALALILAVGGTWFVEWLAQKSQEKAATSSEHVHKEKSGKAVTAFIFRMASPGGERSRVRSYGHEIVVKSTSFESKQSCAQIPILPPNNWDS